MPSQYTKGVEKKSTSDEDEPQSKKKCTVGDFHGRTALRLTPELSRATEIRFMIWARRTSETQQMLIVLYNLMSSQEQCHIRSQRHQMIMKQEFRNLRSRVGWTTHKGQKAEIEDAG